LSFTAGRVALLGVGAYAPAKVVTNEDWSRHVDTTDAWITTRTGIKRRHMASDEESTSDLAVAAARSALADAQLTAAEIDEIIVCTDTPDVYIPDTASIVQHRLQAREIPAYDLARGGCAGFLQGVDIACSRTRSGGKVLVIGVQLLLRLIDWKDRNSCVLFGDAAGAAVVAGSQGGGEILAVVSGTDGSKAAMIGMEVGGTRLPFTMERARQDLHRRVSLDGRGVLKEAVRRMTQGARAVLEKAGCQLDEVTLFVPHQANLRVIEALARNLELPMDKVFVNIEEYGNTGAASIPLALYEARGRGRLRQGDLVLLTAFGAGLHWSAALIRF
jgi:3-oxoacyl-[acyl-carrier-protein] synthase-3